MICEHSTLLLGILSSSSLAICAVLSRALISEEREQFTIQKLALCLLQSLGEKNTMQAVLSEETTNSSSFPLPQD